MRRIAIIPARSGSKGLKDKNIKELNGKPLICYSIETALKSKMFDKILVSTDSQNYADIAIKCGAEVPFLRSIENSDDNASSWDVVREVISNLEVTGDFYDEIMLLQPTSPLRNTNDIIESIKIFNEKSAEAVISLTECDHSPLWCNTLPLTGLMDEFEREEVKNLPRQMIPTFYRYNGAIYLLTAKELKNLNHMFEHNCYAYIMPRYRSIDIDTDLDFILAEAIMKAGLV